jgi:hypothetical protein
MVSDEEYALLKAIAFQHGTSIMEVMRQRLFPSSKEVKKFAKEVDIIQLQRLIDNPDVKKAKKVMWTFTPAFIRMVHTFIQQYTNGVFYRAIVNYGSIYIWYLEYGEVKKFKVNLERRTITKLDTGDIYMYRRINRRDEFEFFEIETEEEAPIEKPKAYALPPIIKRVFQRFADEIMGSQYSHYVYINGSYRVYTTDGDWFYYFPRKDYFQLDWLMYRFDGREFVKIGTKTLDKG